MPLHCGSMLTSRRSLPLLGATMLFASGCFGEYTPSLEATESSTGAMNGTSSSGSSTSSSSSSTGEPLLCDHVNILILTDVSVSMAPFASGIVNVLLALGAQIEETLASVGTYRLALAFNSPPIVNAGAYFVPEGGEGCEQVGALIRGQDACVEEFDRRPFLTESDDLGGGLTCLAEGVLAVGLNPAYERPRILDTLLAILGATDEPALSVCNEGFHESPDPLVVIVIADAEDESDVSVIEAVTRAVGTQQGPNLKKIGVLVVGEDTSACPDDAGSDCAAEPACRVQEFIDSGFSGPLEGNVRRFSICRSLEENNSAEVAADLLDQLRPVLVSVCG